MLCPRRKPRACTVGSMMTKEGRRVRGGGGNSGWPSCGKPDTSEWKASEAPDMRAPPTPKQRKLPPTLIHTSGDVRVSGREGNKTALGNLLYFNPSALKYKEITSKRKFRQN